MERHHVPKPDKLPELLEKCPAELKEYITALEKKQVEMSKDVQGVVMIIYQLFEQTGINAFIRKEQEKAERFKAAGKEYGGPNFLQVAGKIMPMLNKGKDVFTNPQVQKFTGYIIEKYKDDVEELAETYKQPNNE